MEHQLPAAAEVQNAISGRCYEGVPGCGPMGNHVNNDDLVSLLRIGDHPDCTCVCCRAARELERLQEEDRQWDKHSLVEIVQERNCLRDALTEVADVMEKDGRFPTTVSAIRATLTRG